MCAWQKHMQKRKLESSPGYQFLEAQNYLMIQWPNNRGDIIFFIKGIFPGDLFAKSKCNQIHCKPNTKANIVKYGQIQIHA